MVVNVLESDENEPPCDRYLRDRRVNRRAWRAREAGRLQGSSAGDADAVGGPGSHALELIAFYQTPAALASRAIQNAMTVGLRRLALGPPPT